MRREKKATVSIIGPTLAHLGFYAASIKPGKGHAWVGAGESAFLGLRRSGREELELTYRFSTRPPAERQEIPPNPLINISESALLGLLDPKVDKKGEIKEGVIKRTKEGMMRVYPKVRASSAFIPSLLTQILTRSSSNLPPGTSSLQQEPQFVPSSLLPPTREVNLELTRLLLPSDLQTLFRSGKSGLRSSLSTSKHSTPTFS